MRSGAERVVFAGFLPNAAAVLYEFLGSPGTFARVMRIRATNIGAATTVNFSVVPTGITITNLDYAEVSVLPLAAAGADESILEYEPDSEVAGMKLQPGDRIVGWCADANRIAGRIEIEDVRGS